MFSSVSGIFLAFHFILWFESLNYTSVASSTVLVTLQPLFAFFGSYFIFKERFSGKAVISCVLAIFGSVMISWGDFRIKRHGLLWGYIGAHCLCPHYGLYDVRTNGAAKVIAYTSHIYCVCYLHACFIRLCLA